MYNKIIRLAVTSILLTSLSLPALAAGTRYAALQGGSYGLNEDNKFYDGLFDDYSARVSGGYMWATDPCLSYGLELGFQHYSKISARYLDMVLSYKRQSLDLLGVLDYKFAEKFDVFAKAGAAVVYEDFKARDSFGYIQASETSVTPKAAIGVGYQVVDNVQVNLSLNHEFERENHVASASSLLLGVSYSF